MDLFETNLAALQDASPRAAARVAAVTDRGGFDIVEAGPHRLLAKSGVVFESRRDPAGVAARQARRVSQGPVVVLGLGTGFLVEALVEAGHEVVAVVESRPEAVAGAMSARNLADVFRRTPLLFVDESIDGTALATLKAREAQLVPLESRVAGDAVLVAFLERWTRVAHATRAPRVLVVGPIYGGSLETARSTARAASAIGAETRLLDFSDFAGGWHALERLPLSSSRQAEIAARYASLLGQAASACAAEWKPDLVLALAQAPLQADVLDAMRRDGARTAMWFVENGRVLRYWQDVAAAYDAFFTIQDGPFLDALRAAGAPRAVYLPTACDQHRHVPVALTEEEVAFYGADVSFAGAPYLNRQRILAGLFDFSPRLWGEGWAKTELAPLVANQGRRFTLDEMVRVFAATRINLNVHSANHVEGLDPEPDYVNPRTFELAACGAFQLVDARTPLPQLFANDELVTFTSVRELREQIRHYLAHADEREAFARRARTRALAEHTYENRVKRILREMLPPELACPALATRPHAAGLDEAIEHVTRSAREMAAEEAMLRVLQKIQRRDV